MPSPDPKGPRSLKKPLAALFCSLALLCGLGAGGSANPTHAAAVWLASLDDDQRDDTLHDFDDDERFDLRLAPLWLEGLRRDHMSDAQWQGWRRVLATTLSTQGLRQVETVITLEREVRRRDGQRWFGDLLGRFVHGENRYYVALFGEPVAGQPWGLRFDGHHVSLNWTVAADGSVSTEPSFLGAEPRRVPDGWERAGLQAMADEEETARALWKALDAKQREDCALAFGLASGPGGGNRPLFVGEGDRPTPGEPVGLARGAMDTEQRARFDRVVDTYLARLAAPLRAARHAELETAGRDALHFAWAGSFTPGEPLYYRIHGPTFLIEFDNTVAEADHIHTIVRDLDDDFGRDLLVEHHAAYHAAGRIAGLRGR